MRDVFNALFWSASLVFARLISAMLVMKVVSSQYDTTGVGLFAQAQAITAVVITLMSAPANGLVRFTARHEHHELDAVSVYWKSAVLWQCTLFLFLVFLCHCDIRKSPYFSFLALTTPSFLSLCWPFHPYSLFQATSNRSYLPDKDVVGLLFFLSLSSIWSCF